MHQASAGRYGSATTALHCVIAGALLQVVPGELTVVTGVPNSGKSEWLDALAVNLMKEHGWSIAYCSLENPPDRQAGHVAA